ncbi:MAG: hypothetical protein AABY79_10960 [Nitrospirota bacterium]|jgi:hypothetical protein
MTDWKGVIRDIVIILVLIFIGTFLLVSIAKTAGAQKFPVTAIAVLNILLGSIGFAIRGVAIKVNRFKHILKVAFGVWIVGSINVIFLMILSLCPFFTPLFSKPA